MNIITGPAWVRISGLAGKVLVLDLTKGVDLREKECDYITSLYIYCSKALF